MKQTIKKMVMWLVLLSMMVAIFASCDNSGSDNHTHNTSSVEKETTSSTQGDSSSTEESSSSTENSTSNTESHRHSFGEWSVIKEATCDFDGEQERHCSCGEKEKQIIKAKGHTESVIEGKEATCTESGLTDGKKCSVCGEILQNQETIVAKGHSYQAVVTKPTPTEKGYTTYTCACGDSYISDYVDPVLPELPHIVVSNAIGSVGKTVEITIALKNNPGLASLKLKVSFDDTALTLNSVTYNNAIGGMSQQPQTMKNPTTLNWFNGAANSNGDFVYATLTFTVNETAVAGNYEITVTYDADDVYNIDYDNVEFGVINGKIAIS